MVQARTASHCTRGWLTLDGYTLGSLGEVYAQTHYGIELLKDSYEVHDGRTPDDRLVQIEATQRESVSLNECPYYLLVFHIGEDGRFEEIYNGPRQCARDASGRMQKNEQKRLSFSRLTHLASEVQRQTRTPSLREVTPDFAEIRRFAKHSIPLIECGEVSLKKFSKDAYRIAMVPVDYRERVEGIRS